MAEQEFDAAEVAAAIARHDQAQAFLSEAMPGVVEEVRGHHTAGMIDPEGALAAALHHLEAHMSQDDLAQVAILAMAQLAGWIIQAEKLGERIADRDAAFGRLDNSFLKMRARVAGYGWPKAEPVARSFDSGAAAFEWAAEQVRRAREDKPLLVPPVPAEYRQRFPETSEEANRG